jgi:hypothetical protein
VAVSNEYTDCSPETSICPNAFAYIDTAFVDVAIGISPAFGPSNMENCVFRPATNVDLVVLSVLNDGVVPYTVDAGIHKVPPRPSVVKTFSGGIVVLLSPFARIFLTLRTSIYCVVWKEAML